MKRFFKILAKRNGTIRFRADGHVDIEVDGPNGRRTISTADSEFDCRRPRPKYAKAFIKTYFDRPLMYLNSELDNAPGI